VDISITTLTQRNIAQGAEGFHRRHEELFTYCERNTRVEIINLAAIVLGRVERLHLPILARGMSDAQHAQSGERRAFFADAGGFVATPVFIGANLLVGNVVHGAAMIEEETSTIVVFPGWEVELTNPGMDSMVSHA